MNYSLNTFQIKNCDITNMCGGPLLTSVCGMTLKKSVILVGIAGTITYLDDLS